MPSTPERAWRTALELVRERAPLRDGFEAVARACAASAPHAVWATLAALPLERDEKQLGARLYEVLDADPPARAGELWFRLRVARWRERADACDVEVCEGPPGEGEPGDAAWHPPDAAASSAVLTQLLRSGARLERGGPADRAAAQRLEEELALTFAALVVQPLVERVDAALLLGGRDGLFVTVGYDRGPGIALGWLVADGWNRAGFGLLD